MRSFTDILASMPHAVGAPSLMRMLSGLRSAWLRQHAPLGEWQAQHIALSTVAIVYL